MVSIRQMAAIAGVGACFAICGLAGADSGDEAGVGSSSVFVDPRIPSSAMPPAPSAADRSKILEVLRSSPQVCGSDLLSNPDNNPLPQLAASLRALPLESALVPSLGHIILTESSLVGLPFRYALALLVRVAEPGDRAAERVILIVDQLAPVVADRLLGLAGDKPRGLRDLRAGDRPEIERMLQVVVDSDAVRGQVHNIRSSLAFQASRSHNADLSQALAEAKVARGK